VGIACGADCTEEYTYGTAVTLTATPDTGSYFSSWSGDVDCLDGIVTIDKAESCTATFDIEIHSLTVTKAGNGGGTVTSAPVGIACGADCTEDYDGGTAVTLTAVPDAGSDFTGWSGDVDCTDGIVTMDVARGCTATFELDDALTVTKAGSGTGTVTSVPAGIACGVDCTEVYINGTEVTLTATPDTGSDFTGWSGDVDCLDGIVTMDVAKGCTAAFDLQVHTLTVTKAGNGTGTVTSSPVGIDCGADCTEDYINVTEVTLTATPDTGSLFAGWSGDADCVDGVVTVNAAQNCTASFDLQPPYSEDFNNNADGWTAVSGTWLVENGEYSGYGVVNEIVISTVDNSLTTDSMNIEADYYSQPDGIYRNGFIIFDYQGPNDFKYAGAKEGANYWTIGYYDGTAWNDMATLSEVIDTQRWYQMKVEIVGTKATLYVDNDRDGSGFVYKTEHIFSALGTGNVGLATEQAHAHFDNFKKYDPLNVYMLTVTKAGNGSGNSVWS
jgi:hypothetical protein